MLQRKDCSKCGVNGAEKELIALPMTYICQDCLKKQISDAERIKDLEKIADLALDIHTRDPIFVREKWGVSGADAEKKLCEMIEALKE